VKLVLSKEFSPEQLVLHTKCQNGLFHLSLLSQMPAAAGIIVQRVNIKQMIVVTALFLRHDWFSNCFSHELM